MLKWLVDIHQTVVSGSVNWRKAMEKAELLELGLVIRQTLAVSSLLLGTPLPASCAPATLPERLRTFPQRSSSRRLSGSYPCFPSSAVTQTAFG